MPYQSVQRWLGLAKEVTRGTPVAAAVYVPITGAPTFEPKVTWLPDEGQRASPVKLYDEIQGVRHDEYGFKGNVFLDTFPHLIEGIAGSTDAVTGTVAPYTHTQGLANAVATGSQPPSYTVYDVDNVAFSANSAKQMAAGQLSQLDLEFNVDGALNYSAKYSGNPYSEVAAPTWSGGAEVFVPAWDLTYTIGTTVNAVLLSGSLSLKRGVEPIFTAGSNSPYRLWAGPLEVTGKVTFVVEASDSTFTNSLSRLHFVNSFLFTDPISGHTMTVQMSQVQYINPVISSSKSFLEVSAEIIAEANTTDAVATGYSPIKFITTNGQSTAY